MSKMIRKLSLTRLAACKWTSKTRVAYNKEKIQCTLSLRKCGQSTRRNNLRSHQSSRKCKLWHRRQKAKARASAMRKPLPTKKRKRRLKSKIQRVWLQAFMRLYEGNHWSVCPYRVPAQHLFFRRRRRLGPGTAAALRRCPMLFHFARAFFRFRRLAARCLAVCLRGIFCRKVR